ncbi:MAG: response regulator [Chitinispirillaceae bacterium]|nr:response regulator [Chitinispirillaceae bacterium]
MENLIILLAEDDEAQAIIVKRNLKNAGISNKIIHFWHGGEILDFLKKEALSNHPIDTSYLILLDIRMPVINGKEALQQIKEDAYLRKIPVIMLTTSDDPDDISYCYENGCSAYIAKPVTYDKFKVAINNLGLFIKVVSVPKL